VNECIVAQFLTHCVDTDMHTYITVIDIIKPLFTKINMLDESIVQKITIKNSIPTFQ